MDSTNEVRIEKIIFKNRKTDNNRTKKRKNQANDSIKSNERKETFLILCVEQDLN